MIIDDFNCTLDGWIAKLEGYNFEQLLVKPGAENWSPGQLYMHLVEESRYYMEQAAACLGNDENAAAEMTEEAKKMFAENAFPDVMIKGDPLAAENTPQPGGKLQLIEYLLLLKKQADELWKAVCTDKGRGRTMHPGLGYFNAREWIQYAEMHLRHHQRQLKRIENFLKDPG